MKCFGWIRTRAGWLFENTASRQVDRNHHEMLAQTNIRNPYSLSACLPYELTKLWLRGPVSVGLNWSGRCWKSLQHVRVCLLAGTYSLCEAETRKRQGAITRNALPGVLCFVDSTTRRKGGGDRVRVTRFCAVDDLWKQQQSTPFPVCCHGNTPQQFYL